MFDRLIHADWSVQPRKRWAASAERRGGTWYIDAPDLFGPAHEFLDNISKFNEQRGILAGFDFPLGFPNKFGMQTGFEGFVDALLALGKDEWLDFFNVANLPHEISITRPFYPNVARKGVRRDTLVKALGVKSFADLLRVCDRQTLNRQAACAIFWTLGGNQVGKAAITGWKEIVRPALARGARLWPFEGSLSVLSRAPGLVIAETYPAEAYHMVGAEFHLHESKRRATDRIRKAPRILDWANRNAINLSNDARDEINKGFGSSKDGEDRFDAFLGILKMIEVVDGRRPEATEENVGHAAWEGWILGR